MITSKTDLIYYLQQDRLALKKEELTWKTRVKEWFFPDHIFRFQKTLRYAEYFKNKKGGVFRLLFFLFYFARYRRQSLRLGYSIPLNVFGPGLSICHIGPIVVHHKARIGANCRIHVCTNIGASGGVDEAPKLGNNIYLAPGVKIYGDIAICDNVAIAANSAVPKTIDHENSLYGGVPAKRISDVNIKKLIKHID